MADPHLMERFECAPGLRLQAHERLSELHYANIDRRLERLEMMIERLEKRLWLTVYGVVAMVLAQVMQSLLVAAP